MSASLIERAQANRRTRAAKRKPLDLDVPGYGGVLVARYGALEWEDAHRILASEEESARATLEDNLDTVVKGCRALMLRGEDGKLVSLADEKRREGDTALVGEVRYDEVALEALGLTVPGEPDAHKAVLAIFAEANSPELAVALHAGAIGAWMHGADQEDDADLMGGS